MAIRCFATTQQQLGGQKLTVGSNVTLFIALDRRLRKTQQQLGAKNLGGNVTLYTALLGACVDHNNATARSPARLPRLTCFVFCDRPLIFAVPPPGEWCSSWGERWG